MSNSYQQIPLYKDVPLQAWNDWNWQMSNRITRIDQLEQVISLNPEERKDITMGLQKLRMAITPYYASLMNPDNGDCPIRRQAVPISKRSSNSENQ